MYVAAPASADEGCGGSQSNWPGSENVAYFVLLDGIIIRLYKLTLSDQAQHTLKPWLSNSLKIFSRPALAAWRPILLHPTVCMVWLQVCLDSERIQNLYSGNYSKPGCMKYSEKTSGSPI